MNEIINSAGQSFCTFAGAMFIQSTVLVAILFVADWLLRKRVKATFRYWLWMLVFVKLILPPGLSAPTSVGYWCRDLIRPERERVEKSGIAKELTEASTQAIAESTTNVEQGGSFKRSLGMVPSTEPSPSPADLRMPPGNHRPRLTWQGGAFLFWLIGVGALGVILIQRVFFVRRLSAQSRPAAESLTDLLDQCREQMNVHRAIGLRLSPATFSPAVCGLFRPVILLPEALLEKLSSDDLRAVLIHELAHIKRGDLWLNSAQTLLQIAYFYNPFVWLAGAMMRRVREQAVDEMVLVALGAEARSYSRTLVDIAEMAFFKPTWTLRLIGVAESKKSLEGRIKHMLTRPIPKSAKLGLSGVVAILAAATILLPMAKGAAGRSTHPPSPGTPAADPNTEIAIVRWVAFGGPELDKDIRAMAKPVETTSKSCQCLTCDANNLTGVVRRAMQTRKDVGLDTYIRWLTPTSGNTQRMAMFGGGGVSMPFAAWSGAECDSRNSSYTLGTNGAAARFDLDSQYTIRTGKPVVSVEGEMRFGGEMAPGKAVVFLGDVKQEGQFQMSYVVVWQAVAVPSGFAVPRGTNYYASDWIERGLTDTMKLGVTTLGARPRSTPAEPVRDGNDVTVMVGQWMVLVEPSLAKEIRSLSQPVPTASVSYECLTCSGDALAGVVGPWLQQGRTIESSGRLQWVSESSGRGMVGPNGRPATLVRVSDGLRIGARLTGPYRLNTGGDTAKLGLEYQAACNFIHDGETAEIRGSILFTGDIAPGRAIVFLGDLKQNEQSKATQVAVWQAVKTPARLIPYLNAMALSQNWIDAGTSAGLKSAQESFDRDARLSATKTTGTSSKWAQTLPDGAQVKLVAVFRPREGSLQFWNPDGQPVAGLPEWNSPDVAGRVLAVVIERPEYKILDPNARETAASDGKYYTICGWNEVTPDKPPVFAFPHGYGSWQTVGQLRQGQPLEVDGLSYTVERVQSMGMRGRGAQMLEEMRLRRQAQLGGEASEGFPSGGPARPMGSVSIMISCGYDPNAAVRLIVVGKDGKEYPMEAAEGLWVTRSSTASNRTQYSLAAVEGVMDGALKKGDNYAYRGNVRGLVDQDIDHFNLQKRPLAWARLSGFALEPKEAATSSPMGVSR